MNPSLQALFPISGPSSAPITNTNHTDSSHCDGIASQSMNCPATTYPPSSYVPIPVPIPVPVPTRMVTNASPHDKLQMQPNNQNQNQNRSLRTSLNDSERDTFSASYNDSADCHSLTGSYSSLQMKQMKLDFAQQNLELEKRQLRQKMILLQHQRKMQEQVYSDRKRLNVPMERIIKTPSPGFIDLSQSGSGSDEEKDTVQVNSARNTEENTTGMHSDQIELDGRDDKVNSNLRDPGFYLHSTSQSEPTVSIDDSMSLRAAYLHPDRSRLQGNHLIMNRNIGDNSEASRNDLGNSNRNGVDFSSSSASSSSIASNSSRSGSKSSSSSSTGFQSEITCFKNSFITASIPTTENPFLPQRHQTLDPTRMDAQRMSDSEENLSDHSETLPNVSTRDAQNVNSEVLVAIPSPFDSFSSLLSDSVRSVNHYSTSLSTETKSTIKGDNYADKKGGKDCKGEVRQIIASVKKLPAPSIKSFTPIGSMKKVQISFYLISFYLI